MNRDLAITPPNEWCHEQWKRYDDTLLALKELEASPQQGILREAKLMRAHRLHEMAEAKANAADFVWILTGAAPTGEIYIDVPSADLEVRLKW